MTVARLISIDTRSGLLVALGSAILFAPIALTLSGAAMATGLIAGALAIGLGLAGTAPSGRGTLPANAQMAFDTGLGFGLLVVMGAFALAGDTAAAGVFAAAAALALAISATTRYSRPAS